MSGFWVFSWVLIPIAGILAGAFKEWLQFKQTQNQLGTSTEKLEKKVELLEKALMASEEKRGQLIERIQNLETIVTSPDWDTLSDPLLKEDTRTLTEEEGASTRLHDATPLKEDIPVSMTKAARLARRLGA